jgi:DNA-binding Lrp family transcriptional regulator
METHASADLAAIVLNEIPALDGVNQVNASPVLEYFRTVAAWQPGLIAGQEAVALRPAHPPAESISTAEPDEIDAKLIGSLVSDGRAPVSELAEQVGLSIPSVRRRLNTLFDEGVISVRAIVEPADIGLPVEAILWVRVAPAEVREVGLLVAEAPGVRYAVMVMGEYQIMVNVNARTLQELRSFLTESEWVTRALAIRSSTVVRAFKRGGVRLSPLN